MVKENELKGFSPLSSIVVIVGNVNWPPQRDYDSPTDVFIEKSGYVSLVDHGCL